MRRRRRTTKLPAYESCSPTRFATFDHAMLANSTDFQNINRIGDLAMAPDGQSVFVSAGDGFLLPLDSLTFQPVASSNVAVWSGDGRQLVLGTSESLAVWPVDSTASQSMWIGPYPYGGAGHGRLAVDPTATRGWVVSAGIGGLDPPTLVLYDLTPSGTQWTLSAARTVLPENSPVTIQADLMIGGQPAPDGTAVIISSTRPDGGGRTETYYTRDGGITISSLALRGSSRYRFHYWDATNGGAEAYSDVIGTYETALYVLEPLSPSHPGRPLAWFARLTDTFNNALPGRLVDLVRSDGGAGTVVDTAATDFDGWFRLEDTPDAVGVYTYTVRYAGDEAAAPAEHETVITVEKYTGYVGVEAWLGTGRDKRTATVLGSLSGYHTNPILTITATPDGGKPTVIAQGPVADDNTLTARYLMKGRPPSPSATPATIGTRQPKRRRGSCRADQCGGLGDLSRHGLVRRDGRPNIRTTRALPSDAPASMPSLTVRLGRGRPA
jgi:hypothetical protein